MRLAPASPEAHVARGLVLGAQGHEDLAAEDFRAALKARPTDPDALYFLGMVELRAGRADAARAMFERLVKEAPRYPGAEQSLARAKETTAPLPKGAMQLRLLRVRERPRAEEARRRAAAGEDFSDLARTLSSDPSAARGGDLGIVRPDDLADPLGSAARALRPGELSAVLEAGGTYVVLKRER